MLPCETLKPNFSKMKMKNLLQNYLLELQYLFVYINYGKTSEFFGIYLWMSWLSIKVRSCSLQHYWKWTSQWKFYDDFQKFWKITQSNCFKRKTIKEYVLVTISYHLYCLSISKVCSMLHHGLVGRVHSREYYFILTYTFLAFFFTCFSWK